MRRSVLPPIIAALALLAVALPTARGTEASPAAHDTWEDAYRSRLGWWSLQPVTNPPVPAVRDASWPRNDVDRFLLAALESRGLRPAPPADRRTLVRRLAFDLTGLPPSPELVARHATHDSPTALDALTAELLASPQFGEHWARHWLDVVHYADTHGYEWDAPAKNAWRYRDYVVRAFNGDLPIGRFILEQIAGDLLEPRVDPASGLNEAILGPMALRLGERRHGDNAADEGVSQEAVANVIDTVGKGFLGTTLACAQCHDHKLDAVSQQDYYALAGVLMSTRWGVRSADAVDPNTAVIGRLRELKRDVRAELGRTWAAALPELAARIRVLDPAPAQLGSAAGIPETLKEHWFRSWSAQGPLAPSEFHRERARRLAENQANLSVLADFTRPDGAAGWRWEGFGLEHGLVRDGEPVVTDEGDAAILHLLPAGRWSHVWSMRLAGALRSPLFEPGTTTTFSAGFAADRHAGESFIVDQAFHSERMQFPKVPWPAWRTLKAGDFDSLEGSIDKTPRRVFLEWATKAFNNYFPPRTSYGGVKTADELDERSWFGVSRILRHPSGKPPLDELTRFVPLYENTPGDWPERLARLVHLAVERWSRDEADEETVRLLDDALESGWLPNRLSTDARLADAVQAYRVEARKLQPDRTIGSAADWNEARDERIGQRGSYTQFGATVPRGSVRLLGGPGPRTIPAASGRLELAQAIANPRNPLTARVFVNRVWLHLFGEGLVRTPDDFGHLGERPTHPELLDHLAARFIAEGGSLKKLVTLLVSSAAWQQSGQTTPAALEQDPENRLWHHRPLRRLPAESIRDSLLAVSGRLDPVLGGPPIEPHRTAEDPAKRLLRGPLDGLGRRSLYLRMTLMEPPRFLALFNQPIPKLTTGRRDRTSVPDQALALLNDPFVIAMAEHWSQRARSDGAASPEQRVRNLFLKAFARLPAPEETTRFLSFARHAAILHGSSAETDADPAKLLDCLPAWQDVAHALFNSKEFIHVP